MQSLLLLPAYRAWSTPLRRASDQRRERGYVIYLWFCLPSDRSRLHTRPRSGSGYHLQRCGLVSQCSESENTGLPRIVNVRRIKEFPRIWSITKSFMSSILLGSSSLPTFEIMPFEVRQYDPNGERNSQTGRSMNDRSVTSGPDKSKHTTFLENWSWSGDRRDWSEVGAETLKLTKLIGSVVGLRIASWALRRTSSSSKGSSTSGPKFSSRTSARRFPVLLSNSIRSFTWHCQRVWGVWVNLHSIGHLVQVPLERGTVICELQVRGRSMTSRVLYPANSFNKRALSRRLVANNNDPR